MTIAVVVDYNDDYYDDLRHRDDSSDAVSLDPGIVDSALSCLNIRWYKNLRIVLERGFKGVRAYVSIFLKAQFRKHSYIIAIIFIILIQL